MVLISKIHLQTQNTEARMVRRTRSKKHIISTIILAVIGFSFLLYASSDGFTGRTLKTSTSGCSCHGSLATAVTCTITGPATLKTSQQGTYTLTITGGPLVAGGCDIASSSGTLANSGSDLKVSGGELTHTAPKSAASGSVTFQFLYTSPATEGNQTLYAVGLSANNTGGTGGDQWNNAPNFTVNVTNTVPVELTSFTANVQGSNIQLKWATATETNNYGYNIDRMDTKTSIWENIAFVKGNGNSTIYNNYTYTDKDVNAGKYSYRLVQLDINGSTTIYKMKGEVNITAPASFGISQNYPNPFNPSTLIKYQVPENSNVSLKVYNSVGKEVAQLVNGEIAAGVHEVSFDAAHLSSGIYYYTIKAGNNFVQTRKMILLK
jgi:hypothetical protein